MTKTKRCLGHVVDPCKRRPLQWQTSTTLALGGGLSFLKDRWTFSRGGSSLKTRTLVRSHGHVRPISTNGGAAFVQMCTMWTFSGLGRANLPLISNLGNLIKQLRESSFFHYRATITKCTLVPLLPLPNTPDGASKKK